MSEELVNPLTHEELLELHIRAQLTYQAKQCADCENPIQEDDKHAVVRSYRWKDFKEQTYQDAPTYQHYACGKCADPNREQKAQLRAKNKERRTKIEKIRERSPYRISRADRVGDHDISKQEYADMLEAQGGVCASCGKAPRTRQLAIDHDHACNPYYGCQNCIRGLLCGSCNTGIGMLGDNLEGLRRAVAYLEHYESRSV